MAVMMTPRENWTDERLDDLNKKVDKGFADVDAHFDRFERSVNEGFKEVSTRFDRLEDRFEKMEERFHALNRTLIGSAAVIAAAIIGGSAF
jgi:tetrahydromethanopterin S-methyltransferase subunit G